ncbi:MAG: hypothetical protein QNK27_06570 [Desulfuromusa sp.]|nr:hypothetical protein [Desulfuromusa sp.]
MKNITETTKRDFRCTQTRSKIDGSCCVAEIDLLHKISAALLR